MDGKRVNLDAEPSAIQRLVADRVVSTIAEGVSPSAAAARAALASYEQGDRQTGKSEKDAAAIARRVLLSALKG